MGFLRRFQASRQGQSSEQADTDPAGRGSSNYHSFTDRGNQSTSEYRGFSTSINDMFSRPENERVDCCALACCGLIQSDRDRYLITGTKPPSCCRRFWIHVVLPCWIFAMAMACAVNVKDAWLNQLMSSGLVFTFLVYVVIQVLKGFWKRRHVRRELLWSRYNLLETGNFRPRTDDDSHDSDYGEDVPFYMGQTKPDVKNAHAFCGCYASDCDADDIQVDPNDNTCSRAFQCFSGCCCGALCGMHLQLCGICATAQEAREVEKLLHPGYRRIDYVTMQPIMEYYPAIYEARHLDESELSSWFSSWSRLSSFSRWVLIFSLGFCLLLLGWSLLGAGPRFGPENFLVFCATVFQAYAFLKVVHWKHTHDVSTDALIKFFISGFFLSTTTTIIFELIIGLTMRLIMSILMAMSGIDVVESDGFTMVRPGFATGWTSMEESGGDDSSYQEYLEVFGKDHPFIYTIYVFVKAFVLAALVEELCKYAGFRMVEHPDFLSKVEVEQAAECHVSEDDEAENRDLPDFAQQERSLESRGAAITVSMVAASLGFACCENLVYIFIYFESSLSLQITILVLRSMFPVHPIAAALQSIGVCQRDLEKDKSVDLGRIILPGMLFHALYDFFLMWIEFMATRKANYVEADDDASDEIVDQGDKSDFISLIVSLVLMFGAGWFYLRASRQQRQRLKDLDEANAGGNSRMT